MRKTAAILPIVLLSLALAAPARSQNNFAANAAKFEPKPIAAPEPGIPLGERLVYDVYWLGFRVGVGELWVKEMTRIDGREAFHVVGTAKGNGFLARFYPVNNEVHAWIDAQTLRSLGFRKEIEEGGSRKRESRTFDPPAQDFLSAFYWVRRQPLEPGRTFRTPLAVDRGFGWELAVRVLGQKVESLRGQGVVDAILVEPKRIYRGSEDRKGRAWVYLRNDPRRTPVFVRFQTPFGAVVGVLRMR